MKTLLLKDAEALALNKKERILYFLLLGFFFALYAPGYDWTNNVMVWVVFLYSFFYNTIKEKWAILKSRKALLVIMVFYLFNCTSGLLSKNFGEGVSMIGLRIGLFVFPVAIGSIYLPTILKQRLLLGFAVATSSGAIGCLLFGIWRVAQHGDLSLLYNDNLSAIINLQSIYFAMMINLAIFSFMYLLLHNATLLNKNVLFLVIVILFVVHFLLASRVGIFILYTAVFIFAAYYILSKKKVLEGVTLIMGLLLCSFLLVKFFPKTINRFKELTYTKFEYNSKGRESHFNMELTPDQWNGANLRLAVWHCAFSLIKKNIIWGTGEGDKMDVLKKEYAKRDFAFGIATNRNPHNNYLDVWLGLGSIGLILLLLGFFVLPTQQCILYKDWLGLIIIASFMFSFVSESYMDRTMGNTLLGFFMAFISSYKKPSTLNSY